MSERVDEIAQLLRMALLKSGADAHHATEEPVVYGDMRDLRIDDTFDLIRAAEYVLANWPTVPQQDKP